MVTEWGARCVGEHPGRLHQNVAINPPHDYPEFKQFRVWLLSLMVSPAGTQINSQKAFMNPRTGLGLRVRPHSNTVTPTVCGRSLAPPSFKDFMPLHYVWEEVEG